MRFVRIIVATIVLTILNSLFAGLTCGWLFKWVYALEPTNVWVPESAMTTTFFIWLYAGTFILMFLFVLIFSVLHDSIPGACRACKGAMYGFLVWLLGMLPGMFMTYMFMTVNRTVILYWTVCGLVWLLIAGIVTGLIYCRKCGAEGGVCCR